MTGVRAKARNFIKAPNRWERARALTEIRLNRLLYDDKPRGADVISFDEFVAAEGRLSGSLSQLLQPGGEAERMHESIAGDFVELRLETGCPFLSGSTPTPRWPGSVTR